MRPYMIFSLSGLCLLMSSIDSTAVAVAIPHFIKDLNTNVLWAAWTISIYLIAVTSVMPIMGRMSDNYGRKKVLLGSLILFTVSSLACGLASNIYILLAFRFIQGLGGASFLPTAAGIVSDQFPKSRERVIGLFTSIFPIGGIIGPNLGGWIVSQYSWRYIFYINLPIGIMVTIMFTFILKDIKTHSRPKIDFSGALLFFGAVLSFMLGLNLVAENFSIPYLLISGTCFMICLSFFYLFYRQERGGTNPIFDISLLKSRPFMAANLFNMIIGAGVMGLFPFIPLYATSVHKLSTMVSGMILTPRSIAVIASSSVTSFLLKRWGYRWPMGLGVIIIAFSTILLSEHGLQLFRTAGIHLGSAEMLAILMMVTGTGMGFALPASNNACIELMPDKVATITGLRGMFRAVGGTLGVSLITVILHTSSTPLIGFRITFISFGLGLLLSIPLIFLMPDGKH